MASQKRISKSPSLRSAFAFRRSPRLTSSSPPPKIKPISMKSLLKKPPLFNSDALALSLYVNGNEENQDQPTPLKMYDPNSSAEKSVRRSPRCTTNKYKSSKFEPALSNCMRRSPRFSAPTDDREVNLMKSDLNLIEWQGSDAREVGVKWLRSRMVPMRLDGSALSIESPSKKAKTSSARSGLRKSPRLCANVDVKCNLLALPVSSSSVKQFSKKTKTNLGNSHSNVFGGRCSRSRKVPVLLVDEHGETKSKYVVKRKLKEKSKSAFGSCDLGVLGKKCLRSRTIPFRLVGIEDVESKRVLIELPEVLRDKKQQEEIETNSGCFDLDGIAEKKCLRSKKVPICVVGTEKEDTKPGLIALPVSLGDEKQEEIKTASGSCDFDGIVEKCLRSRKVAFRVVGTENEDTKRALIALPDVSAEKKPSSMKKEKNQKTTCSFFGQPVPEEEARERWRWRYELKSQRSGSQGKILNEGEEDEIILNVECHYTQAKVDSCIFNLGDCAYIKGDGRQKHVGRILEFFKTTDGEDYFRVQWFFRAEDTVMKEEAACHDKKRLFYSTLMNDNLLDCIISKVIVIQVAPTLGLQLNSFPPSDFYYDMEYCVGYSTFRTLLTDYSVESCDLSLRDDIETLMITATPLEEMTRCEPYKAELALLDLYSGCGGMSTGLCLGAKLSSVNLVTRWAVDADNSACDSLKLNHPETQVRNENAEDFLELLKGWEKLCQWYVFNNLDTTLKSREDDTREVKSNLNSPSDVKISAGEFEVLRLVDICYEDQGKSGKRGLKFKVRWKGYSSSEDTWEPIEALSKCQERIQDFVRSGFKSKILPLPGDVDVLCGGPPCQGISGFNRYRNIDAPLDDERNHQIVVFMDIVKFLRPKYVLMENVVDILKFDKASLARYALSRLVNMKYQARLGTMAAGCYGLPQFRLRVFLWGALPSEKLPQYPLPTHDVVVRNWPPLEFEQNTVAYDEGEPRELEEPIILRDAISDLPAVTSHEICEQMTYGMPPETEFQKYIRLTKDEMMGFAQKGVKDAKKAILHDHRPYQLSEDDYLRVCQIPHKKGANFRDLPGLVVGHDNMVRRDATKEQMMLPSGKPMVPDYVLTFEQGKSKRPFARLWWDETVPTVVTFPNLRNQAALHPEQDRVLTIREYARLQGFPDFYRFCGTVKKRYCQVGNAVAVPVARALGYSLGIAVQKLGGNEPLMTLPPKFTFQLCPTD